MTLHDELRDTSHYEHTPSMHEDVLGGVERPSKIPKLEQAQSLQLAQVVVPNHIQDAPVPPAEDTLEQDV